MRSLIVRLAILLLLGISSLGCGPHAPRLTFCLIRGDRGDVRCQNPEGKKFTLTIKEANRFVAQPPDDAEKLRLYVIDLEKQVAHCQ